MGDLVAADDLVEQLAQDRARAEDAVSEALARWSEVNERYLAAAAALEPAAPAPGGAR